MLIPRFEPHPLLRGGHAQTVFATLAPRRARYLQATKRREFSTDVDTRVVALCDWQSEPRSRATLILLHGLQGSAESPYLVGTADKAFARGFNTVRLNMRNCGGTLHLTPTLYHSGLTHDLRRVIFELIERDGLERLVLAGFSLGGNVVLKLLGELGDEAPREILGAVCVSPPVDLARSSAAIGSGGMNAVYERRFLRLLKDALREKSRLFPDLYDVTGLEEIRTLREFDERYTAPHFGFRGASDYYEKASSLPLIPRIRVDTWIVSARDDALIPAEPLQDPEVRANPAVRSVVTEEGGHVAFVGRRPASVPGYHDQDRRWAENRIVQLCIERDSA